MSHLAHWAGPGGRCGRRSQRDEAGGHEGERANGFVLRRQRGAKRRVSRGENVVIGPLPALDKAATDAAADGTIVNRAAHVVRGSAHVPQLRWTRCQSVVQDVTATEFPRRKSVMTGSWLTRSAEGRGFGKEMRAGVFHLAFDGLGALEAHSRAFTMNPASIAVSKSVGYEANGESIALRGRVRDRSLHFRMSRERWDERRRDDILIFGLEACLPMFGLG